VERDHQPGVHQFLVKWLGFVGDFNPLTCEATVEQGQGGIG
jgi:hypothetical protein